MEALPFEIQNPELATPPMRIQDDPTQWTCWSCGTAHQIRPPSHKCGGPPIYEKPVIVKQDGMTFPLDIMELFNGGKFCMQCSGCHGCR